MTIRVTQNMLNSQMLYDLTKNMDRMRQYQNELSTGKKINKPSDNPVGVTYVLRYNSDLATNSQYENGANSSSTWLKYTNTALTQVNQIVQKVRTLAVQASNGTNDTSSLNSIKQQIQQLYDQLVTTGNTQMDGKYIFNGQQTNVQPYPPSQNAAALQTDSGQIQFSVSPKVTLPVNVTGNDVFGTPGSSDNIFSVMQNFISDLSTNNTAGLNQVLTNIDSRYNNILNVTAGVGAKTDRITAVQNQLQTMNNIFQTLQSNVQDANIPQVVTNMQTAQNVYQASLSVGAKIIQPSLVDYLK